MRSFEEKVLLFLQIYKNNNGFLSVKNRKEETKMKRSISLVLCLAMLVSVFSCFGVTASAAGDPQKLFTVKEGEFKNDKITYTIYLNKGVSLMGAIIYAKFDSEVLAIDEANTGAYMTTDSYGDECYSINGEYEQGFMVGYDNQYSVAHVNATQSDYKPSSNRAYMKFTFKAIDAERPATEVKFYCYEFNNETVQDNNIPNGKDSLVHSDTRTTLGKVVINSVETEKDGVRVSWKKVTGADFYRVYKKINGEYEIINETTDLNYLDTEVENNVSYSYAVRAVNEASSDYAATRSDAVSTRYTVAPTGIKATNDDGVLVSWSKVEGATAYRVYRRNVNADGTVGEWDGFKDKVTSTKFIDDTAVSGKTYQYAVRTYSDGGNSMLSAEQEILYLAIPKVSIEATVKGVKVTWSKVGGAELYRVYRKVSGGSWERIKSTSSASYTDTSAPSGKKVYYMVRAVNGSVISDYASKSLTYLKTPTVSVKNTTSGVYSSWKKVSGATSYEIYRKAGSAKSWTKIATTKKTSYTDKNVKSGTTYKYAIRAVNSSTKSKYGSTAYETIKYLSAPKLEKITSTKSGVTVYWNTVKGASKYLVYRKTGSGEYELIKTVSGAKTVKYLDKTAKKGKTYSYKVYAGYSSYKSSYKSTFSIKDKY